ncbi:hypothetical protein N5I15_08250 [Acinetobacter johnsonii]|uniref:hypothetical protein n=1 Tax=Acinetobacter johnsonii TaxID=40214 RepID=UPI00244AFFF5|nr:hypothetical protein [Acinetobacter johnsonii]MDH1532367.1 hypothetical protein [Acinetobacter johnsonii]
MNFDKSVIKRLTVFLTGNVVAQGTAAISGLLLARWLSVEDYAAYTIIIVLMGAITLLTKGGAHLGYTAILGRVWPDMNRVSGAILAVLSIRKLISLIIMPFLILTTWVLLRNNEVSQLHTNLILIFFILFWWADLRTRLVDQVLYFAKQTTKIQILDTVLSFIRLLCIFILFYFGILNLVTAVFLSVLVALLRIRPILKWIDLLLPKEKVKVPLDSDLIEIKQGVKRQMPVELYTVFQSQLILIVLTLYGTVNEVAGFGALTRINQLLLPVEALTFAFLIPYFSRSNTIQAFKIYFPLVFMTLIPGLVLLNLALFFPQLLLWIVGPNYADLNHELIIAVSVAVFLRGTHTAWALLAHRGWVKFSWVQIPVGLSLCLISPLFLDLSKLSDALLLQLAFGIGVFCATSFDFYFAFKNRNMKLHTD